MMVIKNVDDGDYSSDGDDNSDDEEVGQSSGVSS